MKKKPKAQKHRTGSKRTPLSKATTSSTVNPSKWIRTERPFLCPEYVKHSLRVLDQAGHVAYIVGGSVRDYLLNLPSKDFDIATSADPDEICRLFPKAITVGKAFGVIKVPVGPAANRAMLEIATFREDLLYKDHRHPESVRFAGPVEDANRRDFTINGLFYDPQGRRILDCVGGVEDLRLGVVRAIGDPTLRFKEDALRLLRAVRFSGRFGFKIDEATLKSIRERARLISRVSGERIRDELTAMLLGPAPALSMSLLADTGLLLFALPEVDALRTVPESPSRRIGVQGASVFDQTLKVLDQLMRHNPTTRTPELAWATLLSSVGKASVHRKSGGKDFNGYELEGARLVHQIGDRLRFSASHIDVIEGLVAGHVRFREVFQMREATLERLVREQHFDELLALHRADATASDGNLAFYEFCLTRWRQYRSRGVPAGQRLVTGEDLIDLGFKPGPRFAQILRELEDMVLERKLVSKEQALEYVIRNYEG